MTSTALVVPDLHVVLGAGPLGRATATALQTRGHRVRIISRSAGLAALPQGVEHRVADLSDRDAAQSACAGAVCLYFCAQPPYHRWPQAFPALQEAAIAAAAVGARLVVAENLYAYGPSDHPLTEDLPPAPRTRKGKVRAALHQRLMRAHQAGAVSVAVARAADFFGPWVEGSAVGSRAFQAIVAGRAVEVFGDPDTAHSYTFVEDFGAALAVLGTDPRALGQVWHVPNAPAVSTARFMDLAFRLAETRMRLRRVSRLEMRLVGLAVPPVYEMIEMLPTFQSPLRVDHGKFARLFGDLSTPLEAALARTITWTRETAK